MGAAQDDAARMRNPQDDAKGGVNMKRDMEFWQLMHPAAGKIRSLRRTPLGWLRNLMRKRFGYV